MILNEIREYPFFSMKRKIAVKITDMTFPERERIKDIPFPKRRKEKNDFDITIIKPSFKRSRVIR